MNRTLFEKVWSEHVIVVSPQGEDLLYVDFNLINEGQSFLAFDQLRNEGRRARRPQQHLAVTDHYLPTVNRSLGSAGISNPEIRRVVEMLDENAAELALPHIGWHHRDQGIAHVIAPELGLAQPGMLITCNDSHTATNGACGALAVPIGGSNQLRHVLATQTVWLKKPQTMRIFVEGALPPAVTAKDVILSIIREVGVGGATGYAVEYAGSAVRAMSMEARMTICNMSIEAGARLHAAHPFDPAPGDFDRPGLHRLLHQQPHRGPSCRRAGIEGAADGGSGNGLPGLERGEAAGGIGGARCGLLRGRPRVAGRRLLHVQRLERRAGRPRRALRIHHQSELRGPPGARRAHPYHEPGDGRRGGRLRTHRRCSPLVP